MIATFLTNETMYDHFTDYLEFKIKKIVKLKRLFLGQEDFIKYRLYCPSYGFSHEKFIITEVEILDEAQEIKKRLLNICLGVLHPNIDTRDLSNIKSFERR